MIYKIKGFWEIASFSPPELRPHSPRINSWAKNAASPQPSPKEGFFEIPSVSEE